MSERPPQKRPASSPSSGSLPKKMRLKESADKNLTQACNKEQEPFYCYKKKFVVVQGINSFLRGPYVDGNFIFDPNLLKEVLERIVFVVTKVMAEFCIYMNFHFRNFIRENDQATISAYFQRLGTAAGVNNFRQILFFIQGKRGRLYRFHDAAYRQIRAQFQDLEDVYDCSQASPIFQEQVKQYITSLKNLVQISMKRRLIKYYKVVEGMSRQQAVQHATNVLSHPFPRCPYLNESFQNLESRPLTLIPFLYWLQRIMSNAGVKSFVVVPRPSYQMRHIHITNTGLVGLFSAYCTRTGQRGPTQKEIEANYRGYWMKLFDIAQHENKRDDFRGICTNNVKVSILMERHVVVERARHTFGQEAPRGSLKSHRVNLFNSRSKPFPPCDRIIGLDPGRRLMVGGVSIDTHTGDEVDIKLSSKFVHQETGRSITMSKFRTWAGHLENVISISRAQAGNIGHTSHRVADNVRFELYWLSRRVNLYSDSKFRERKFTFYIKKRKFYDNYVSQLCPPGMRSLVFLGNARMAPFIKG
jgi:hypothetical protein